MDLTIRSVKFAAGNKSDMVPMRVVLIRELPGPDRPDYWLGALREPFSWTSAEGDTFEISHLVLASQWEGTGVTPGISRLPVGVAYVVDQSLLDDEELVLDKIRFVAHAVADDPEAENPVESLASRVADSIVGMFGKRS